MSTATIPDLWPDFQVSTEPSPATILRQQGLKLGERTRNAVYGEVDSKPGQGQPGEFWHTFYLCAPFLDFRQQTIHIQHGIDRYPAKVLLLDAASQVLKTVEVANAGDLLQSLREMLNDPYVVRLVNSLISQSRDVDD